MTTSEPVIRRVLSHIGEPWAPEVLRFHEKKNPGVYANVHRSISDTSVGKWKEGLTTEQKSVVKDVAGDLLIKLGYADDLGW